MLQLVPSDTIQSLCANFKDNSFFSGSAGDEISDGQKKIIENLTWGELTKDSTDFETKLGILGKTGLILSQLQYTNLKHGYEILQKK